MQAANSNGSAPNLTEYFARTRIINLLERSDRREETRQELSDSGLPFGPRVAFFEASRPASADGFPTTGTKGCYLSHLRVLRLLAESNEPNVLVLEDDIRFEPKRLRGQHELLEELDQRPWDIVYFGRLNVPEPEGDRPKLRVLDAQEEVRGTHCYAIERMAAKRLLTYLEECLTRQPGDPEGGPMHVDGAFSMFRAKNPDIVALIAEPYIAEQRSSRTDVHPLASYDDLPIVRNALALARRARNTVTRAIRTWP